MPSPTTNTNHQRRIERLEDALSALRDSVTSHGAQISAMSVKIDQLLAEVSKLVTGLMSHVKDDDSVERRVTALEVEHAAQLERAKGATEDRRNVKASIWLAGCTLVGDLLLHAAEHLHLFN